MDFYSYIEQCAHELIDQNGNGWFDILTTNAQTFIDSNIADATTRKLAQDQFNVLIQHRADIVTIGVDGLIEFIHQLSLGNDEKAKKSFIQNIATPDELIALYKNEALLTIEEKMRRDQIESAAIKIGEDLVIAGFHYLLPIILGAL